MLRLRTTIFLFSALFLATWLVYSQSTSIQIPPGLRAMKNTYSPVVEVIAPKRTRVTDEQLAKLRTMQIENLWGAVQNKGYKNCWISHLKLTTPGIQTAGRALTMRYLPVRPDLEEGVQQLAKEGNWDYRFNTRAGEDANPGDIVVVELGGMVDRATFMGTMTGLAIKLRKTNGIVVDGGIRDLSGFKEFKDFPVFYAGAHASAMADQVGAEWNIPVRIGNVTVMPGDVIVGDEEGLLVFPPQITEDVIKAAESQTLVEEFKALKMNEGKYPTRDIYPKLSPALEKEFEDWKKRVKR